MVKLIQVDDHVFSLLVGDEKNFKTWNHPDADVKFFFKFLGQDCICMECSAMKTKDALTGAMHVMHFSTPVSIVRGVKGMLRFILGKYGSYPFLEMRTLKVECKSWVAKSPHEDGNMYITEIGEVP